MRIGIDLLWVRVGKCGGTESYIRNILDGFSQYDSANEYVLFVARDNAESFRHYEENSAFALYVCQVDCANQAKRILWENLYLDKAANKKKVDVMFIPVYSKPVTWRSKLPYVTVICDLQAIHFPEYFSSLKRLFLKYSWWQSCKTSNKIITISEYCKDDLITHYPCCEGKIYTLYVPIVSNPSGLSVRYIEDKYGIKKGEYFYCVSSMLPHKNLNTILHVMQKRKEQGLMKEKLVLSGVGGDTEGICRITKELGIQDMVVLTGFVTDEERDCFYENCKMFLFPSIFEGFGMPPIEAMRKGKNVVMTECSCLKEVTEGKAVYVKNPTDADEWMEKIEEAGQRSAKIEGFEKYDLKNVVEQYLRVIKLAIISK